MFTMFTSQLSGTNDHKKDKHSKIEFVESKAFRKKIRIRENFSYNTTNNYTVRTK